MTKTTTLPRFNFQISDPRIQDSPSPPRTALRRPRRLRELRRGSSAPGSLATSTSSFSSTNTTLMDHRTIAPTYFCTGNRFPSELRAIEDSRTRFRNFLAPRKNFQDFLTPSTRGAISLTSLEMWLTCSAQHKNKRCTALFDQDPSIIISDDFFWRSSSNLGLVRMSQTDLTSDPVAFGPIEFLFVRVAPNLS